MSKEQSEIVSRNEEVRAIFIFGLLAVFAYVEIQYPTLTLTYAYGSFNLIPIINILIILWSLYAFFMVLGLSEDTIGKSLANSLRRGSKMFLQYSFMILGVFGLLFGFLIYGSRLILVLFIIATTLIIFLYIYLSKRPKRSHKRLSLKDIEKYLKSGKIRKDLLLILGKAKKYRPLILGLVFLSSITILLYYPDSWLDSSVIIFIFFVVAIVSVSLFLAFLSSKDDEIKEDYDI